MVFTTVFLFSFTYIYALDTMSSKAITDFVDFDEEGDGLYDTLTITEEERNTEAVLSKLPKKVKVVLENDAEQKVPVTWECDKDITNKDENSFVYSMVLEDDFVLSEELQETFDNEGYEMPFVEVTVNKITLQRTAKRLASSVSVMSIGPTVIKEFVDFDGTGDSPLKTMNITEAQRKTIDRLLPDTVEVVLEGGSTISIPATWECFTDIMDEEMDFFVYNLVLPNGYKLSDELQTAIDSEELMLPFIEVTVGDGKDGASTYATYKVRYVGNGGTRTSDGKDEFTTGSITTGAVDLGYNGFKKNKYKVSFNGNGGSTPGAIYSGTELLGWEEWTGGVIRKDGYVFNKNAFSAAYYANRRKETSGVFAAPLTSAGGFPTKTIISNVYIWDAYGYDKLSLFEHWYYFVLNTKSDGSYPDIRQSSPTFCADYYYGWYNADHATDKSWRQKASEWSNKYYDHNNYKGVEKDPRNGTPSPDYDTPNYYKTGTGKYAYNLGLDNETVDLVAVWGTNSLAIDSSAFPTSTRACHSFAGWSTTAGGSAISYPYTPSGNVTLYAKWTFTGHSYGNWTTVTSATCTTSGSEKRTCSKCSAVETRTTSSLGHNYGDWSTTTAATCTADGSKKRTCSRCSNVDTATITKLGHDYSSSYTVDKAATCTEAGSKSQHCSRCSSTQNVTSIPATGHSYGNYITSKEATCTADGSKYRTCSTCSDVDTATITKLGHDYSSSYTVDKAATCTEAGSKSQHCSRCSSTQNVTSIAATGHTPGLAATCTSAQTCTVCGTQLEAALGHNEDNSVVSEAYKVSDANCQSAAVYYKSCSRCGLQGESTFTDGDKNPNNHTSIVTLEGKDATCEDTGLKEGKKCTACDITTVSQQTIPALGHEYEYTGNDAYIEETCKNGCDHKERATLVVDETANRIYTGSAITPLKVEYTEGWTDVKNPDIEIQYSNNTDVATDENQPTGSITINGATTSKTFEIVPATNVWTTQPSILDWYAGDEPSKPVAKASFGEFVVEYKAVGADDEAYVDNAKELTAGNYIARFTVAESPNYNGLEALVPFTINPEARTLTVEVSIKASEVTSSHGNPVAIFRLEKSENSDGVHYQAVEFTPTFIQSVLSLLGIDSFATETVTFKGLDLAEYNLTQVDTYRYKPADEFELVQVDLTDGNKTVKITNEKTANTKWFGYNDLYSNAPQPAQQ